MSLPVPPTGLTDQEIATLQLAPLPGPAGMESEVVWRLGNRFFVSDPEQAALVLNLFPGSDVQMDPDPDPDL